ncbi:hypothetical protein QC762_404660 [Podospora pseudocomata]|uniref:Cerato-platanin n=2 Tax=Podospora TaxID=5144 RepID=A0ABR0GH60_9PEZI|nr:hypothetical protein QC761_404660 [Podospora bellae-mahoneyi]KAK4655107.1 hypothetical protein QC762_404660 [Podospora pseudocomata]
MFSTLAYFFLQVSDHSSVRMFTLSAIFLALASLAAAEVRNITPHEQYSSSVGVLGCKINTHRVAYWPEAVDCNNICVRVSHQGRSLELLRIDQSGGANDISYDAWNYLGFGKSAIDDPQTGGGIDMDVEFVDADQCKHLLKDSGGKLAFSAPNSMNFLSSCLSDPGSWVARNFAAVNLKDSACHCGFDEVCTIPPPSEGNQPVCPNALGTTGPFRGDSVFNVEFGTGKLVPAPGAGVC